MKVNIGKTKIMKSGTNEGPVFASSKCMVCAKKEDVVAQGIVVFANTGYIRDAVVLKED